MRSGFSGRVVAFVLAVAAGVIFSGISHAQTGLVRITENVYSYVDAKDDSASNSYGANAGIVVGGDGILVVDTLVSSKAARKFIEDIREVSGKEVRYVVNTHCHLDHAYGNSEFLKLGASVAAHENCRAYMVETAQSVMENLGMYGLTEEDMEGTEPACPPLTFADRVRIDLGGVQAELIYIGHSHTAGSVLVYLPGEKVLFAGDALFTGYHPFMGEGDMEGWVRALEFIEALDVEKIIPGHGPISGKKDVEEMKTYLLAFDKKARELAAGSDDIDHIVAEITNSVPPRALGHGLIRANIQMKYLKGKAREEAQ